VTIFITEKDSVNCAVSAEYLNTLQYIFSLKELRL